MVIFGTSLGLGVPPRQSRGTWHTPSEDGRIQFYGWPRCRCDVRGGACSRKRTQSGLYKYIYIYIHTPPYGDKSEGFFVIFLQELILRTSNIGFYGQFRCGRHFSSTTNISAKYSLNQQTNLNVFCKQKHIFYI